MLDWVSCTITINNSLRNINRVLGLNKSILNAFPKHVMRPLAQFQVNISLRSTEETSYSIITLKLQYSKS